jgi:hypothetical protein
LRRAEKEKAEKEEVEQRAEEARMAAARKKRALQQEAFAAAELERYETRVVARAEEKVAAERRRERRRDGPLSAAEEIRAVVSQIGIMDRSGACGPAQWFWGLAADLQELGNNVLPQKETRYEISGLDSKPHYNGKLCTRISLEQKKNGPRWTVRLDDGNSTGDVISLRPEKLLPPSVHPLAHEPLPLRELLEIQRAVPGVVATQETRTIVALLLDKTALACNVVEETNSLSLTRTLSLAHTLSLLHTLSLSHTRSLSHTLSMAGGAGSGGARGLAPAVAGAKPYTPSPNPSPPNPQP